MIASRFVAWMWGSSLMIFGAGLVSAQDYPSRPIRIVTSAPGGGTDFASRQIAPELASSLGQNVIVENRAGGAVQVFQAQPNGHTLLLAGTVFWIEPLFQKVSYDPVKNFLPVGLVSRQPLILVVHPSLPAKSIKELVALAKAKPGILNYSSAGTGSSGHLAGELLKVLAGVNIVRIPYKGGGSQLMPDLLTGRVSMSFFSSVIVSPYLKDKRLKALAVSTRTRMSTFPDVPTLSEAGVPGYHADQFSAIVGPPGVPEPIANRLQDAVMHSLKSPEFQARMRAQGTELQPGTGRELATLLRDEYVKWQKVIKDNNITAQ